MEIKKAKSQDPSVGENTQEAPQKNTLQLHK